MSKQEDPCLARLHAVFLQVILPPVQLHARIYFRHVKCQIQRADCIAEAIGLAWKWFVSLDQKGKDATRFPTAIATYAARAVRSGRRVVGQEKSKDVLSPLAQQCQHFAVGKLPDFSTLNGSPLEEALHDNMVSPIPEQVCFRLDFPAWLGTLDQRNRQIAEDMALGHKTQDLAKKHKVSPGRISQLRREFQAEWSRFCGELTEQTDASIQRAA